jgi:DNA-binding MarR family transcriptional regulator
LRSRGSTFRTRRSALRRIGALGELVDRLHAPAHQQDHRGGHREDRDGQFKRDLAATGLTPRQFSVLAVLAQRPSITVADLARAVLTTPQSMAALVDGLEKRGLLLRSAARQRGVAAPLAPTPAGLAALAHAAPRIATSEKAVFGHLTEQQRDALNRILADLEDHTADSDDGDDNRAPSDRA